MPQRESYFLALEVTPLTNTAMLAPIHREDVTNREQGAQAASPKPGKATALSTPQSVGAAAPHQDGVVAWLPAVGEVF